MTEFRNTSFVEGTAALKITSRKPRNLVRLQQQDFLRDAYRRQDQPSEITYRAFVAQVAREAANRLAHGTIAGEERGVFSTREITVFAICTTITLLTAQFAG